MRLMQPKDIDCKKILQGDYEAQRLPEHFSADSTVPDFAFNVLNPMGALYRPVVDEYQLSQGMKPMSWPGGKPFAVCLTHDVDLVSLYALQPAIRHRKILLLTASSAFQILSAALGVGLDLTRALKNGFNIDPLFCFEKWLEAENQVGGRSTFFFWPGCDAVSRPHFTDCAFNLSDRIVFDHQACTVAEMIREIHTRGGEIGLHPSWYAFDDVNELKRQKNALETVLGQEVVSVRQHFLHYDIRKTPRNHAQAGFQYDSTLGFNDNIGFRFGTCYPWRLYDMEARESLPIIEVPLIIQDSAMLNPLKGLRLDGRTAFEYIQQIATAVKIVGGILTLSWHPNNIVHPVWWDLYVRTLDYLQQHNAFFGSIRDIMTVQKNVS